MLRKDSKPKCMLGPYGIMPNPKAGTFTPDIAAVSPWQAPLHGKLPCTAQCLASFDAGSPSLDVYHCQDHCLQYVRALNQYEHSD